MGSQKTLESLPTLKLNTSPLSEALTPSELKSLQEETKQSGTSLHQKFRELLKKNQGEEATKK